MRLVEGVLREVVQLLVDLQRGFFGNAVFDAAGHRFAVGPCAAVNEQLPQVLHHLGFLFAHGVTHVVCKGGAEACQLFDQLHYLFLVDDTAVGNVQYAFHRRVQVMDFAFVEFALDVVADVLHGTWTVQADTCDNFFKPRRLHFAHKVAHAAAFKLEDAHRVARRNEVEHVGVAVVVVMEVHLDAVVLVHVVAGFFDVGEGAQSQEVHFEQTKLLHLGHVVLRGDDTALCKATAVGLQRNVVGNLFAADNYACGVHARLTGRAFKAHCNVDKTVRGGVGIGLLQFLGNVCISLFLVRFKPQKVS